MNTQLNENAADLDISLSSRPTSGRATIWYYPWVIITLCAFFLFFKYVLQVSPSVMTKELMTEFQINGVGLGNLAATYFYAYLVTQLFVGPLLDRYSPRYLTAFAILLCAWGAFAFARADSITAALLSRALMGAGTAFATVSYMKMSALWFRPNQVAFVDGLLATAAMAGALCGQVPLNLLVQHSGWRDSLIYCGMVGVIFAIVFFLVVKDKKTDATAVKAKMIQLSDIRALFKDRKNWLLTLYSGLAFTPIAVLGGLWGNPFFEVAHGLTSTEAAYFSSLIFLGLGIGGPVFGYLAGRVDSIRVMIMGTAIAFVALVIALYMVSIPLWLFGALLFAFGFGTGVFMLSFPLGKEMNPIGLAATVVALINTGDALFGSFTEPLIGRMLDMFSSDNVVNGMHVFSLQNYHVALALLPLYLLISLGCLLGLQKLRRNAG